jgi:nucleotide-binding universal stress UspA family protein
MLDSYSQTAARAFKEDISDILDLILKKDIALLGQIQVKGKATQLIHYWLADEQAPEVVTATSSMSGADKDFQVSAGDYAWVNVGDILKDKAVDELLRVASKTDSGYHIVVTKYPTDANVAVHSATAQYRIVSRPKLQGGTPGDDPVTVREQLFNTVQLFERGIKLTDEAKQIAMRGVTDELSYQIEKKTYEVKRELGFAVIYGNYKAASAITEASTMSGILEILNVAAANRVDASGDSITETMINDAVEEILNDGVTDPDIIVCGTKVSRDIGKFGEDYVRLNSAETKRGHFVDTFRTDTGLTLPIILEPELDDQFCMILRKKDLALVPFDPWSRYVWPRTGYAEQQSLKGSYTFEMRNYKRSHALIYGLG